MMNLYWRLLVAVADAGNISRRRNRNDSVRCQPGNRPTRSFYWDFRVFIRERRYIGVTALGGQVVGTRKKHAS